MSKLYGRMGLYEHNYKIFLKVMEALKEKKTVSCKRKTVSAIQATGTGKSYVGLEIVLQFPHMKILYVEPSVGIIEHLNEIIESCPDVDIKKDFSHVEFLTYQKFINMSKKELADLKVDMLIIDELHHIGAPVWGERINTIIETHPDITILGFTAYSTRRRGTQYERDLTEPDSDEIFSGSVVSRYDICDAMIDGVIPKFNYKSAHSKIKLMKLYENIEKSMEGSVSAGTKKEYAKILRDVKKRIHEAPSAGDCVKKLLKKDGKYLYFCPVNPEKGINDMDTIIKEFKKWLYEMGLKDEDIVIYKTTSKMRKEGKRNREAFYNDKTINGETAEGKFRIMFAINQYNEGVHAPNIDGVILGRTTYSDIVFFEAIGRALAVGEKNKEKLEEYESYPIEKLIHLCEERDIVLEEGMTKEEIIEKLLAPTIIDLADNIDFIKQLENNLKDRVEEVRRNNRSGSKKRKIKISNASFDIEMENEDIFELLKEIRDNLIMSWDEKYELLKAYYEHYRSSEVPQRFKTKNGYDEDKEGVSLGIWADTQRRLYKKKKLSLERIKLLQEIGFRFEANYFDTEWQKNYELLKIYYKHHGQSDVPTKFKTINGYEEAEEGINLGVWVNTQRLAYKNEYLSSERIKLLQEIGFRFEANYFDTEWQKNYELLKIYYKHHGHSDVSAKFKTKNGYEESEEGFSLGQWVSKQRTAYKVNSLSLERMKLLQEIEFKFETDYLDYLDTEWQKNYELLKIYYKHYGHSAVPTKFKTINGYEESEEGVNLGKWVDTQRTAYKNKYLSSERIELLQEIEFRLETKDWEEEWQKKYELLKIYYKHHGRSDVLGRFKTLNGYDYAENGVNLGRWVNNQRKAYKNNSLSSERILLLEKIEFKWQIKKNKVSDITSLCLEYGINREINSEVLDYICLEEFRAKIEYLNYKNISVIDENGKLNEIFNMSNIDMHAIYGITVYELLTKSYLEGKSKKRTLECF